MPVPIPRIIAASGLAALGLFQTGLAAGIPWGEASYGGAHRGTLPDRLRATSAVAAPVYLTAAGVVGKGAAPRALLGAIAGIMGVAVIPNLASPSPKERLWAPVCATIAVASAMELRRTD